MEWPEACAGVHVLGGWARAAAAGMPNSAAYGLLVNLTGADDTLVNISGDAAAAIELHEMTMGDGDVMQMRPIEGGILVPAGGTALLQPGGKHIMMIGLTGELQVDTSIELTLAFASGSELTIEFPVREEAAEAMGEMG
jgi:copper(I)-binding protein